MQRQATAKFFSAAGKHMRKKRARLKIFCINTDHLGNTRVSFQDADQNGAIDLDNEVVETNDYYPFGLEQQKANTTIGSTNLGQKFKYNGKEFEDDLGYNMYDYDLRHYDPAIGRWVVIDPLAEQMRRHSPYNYAFDNPIFFIDPDGMAPIATLDDDPIYNKKGELIGDDGKTEGKIHIVYNKDQAKNIKSQTESGNNAVSLEGVDKVTLNGGTSTVGGVVASVEAQSNDTGRDPSSSDAGLHEEGGHTEVDANGNVTTVAWEPGPKKDKGGKGTIKLFNGISPQDYPSTDELADYWHVHTSKSQEIVKEDGTVEIKKGSMGPSGGDTNMAKNLKKNGYNATAIQVGTSSGKKVNFYNSQGTITTMSLKKFNKLRQ